MILFTFAENTHDLYIHQQTFLILTEDPERVLIVSFNVRLRLLELGGDNCEVVLEADRATSVIYFIGHVLNLRLGQTVRVLKIS